METPRIPTPPPDPPPDPPGGASAAPAAPPPLLCSAMLLRVALALRAQLLDHLAACGEEDEPGGGAGPAGPPER